MKKVLFGLMFILMVLSLFVFYGCGASSSGGGSDYTQDENLVKAQMASLMEAIKDKNTTEALAIFSDQFIFVITGESGEIDMFADKASLEAMLGMAGPYLDYVTIDTSECPNPAVKIYPEGVRVLSTAQKGAGATLEGTALIKLHNIQDIPLDFLMGAVSTFSLKKLDSGMPFNSIMSGSYASVKGSIPLIFTKEATTGNQSDWKIVGVDMDTSQGPPYDRLFGLVATVPGTQSAFSIGIESTIESSLTNEKFVLAKVEDSSDSPLIAFGLNPGITANTTYNPTLDFLFTWGLEGQIAHTYKTRVAGSGSGHVTGEVKNASSGKLAGVYLVPYKVIEDMMLAMTGVSVKSINNKAAAGYDPLDPDQGGMLVMLGMLSGAYSDRAVAVTGQGSTSVAYDISSVADGAYAVLAVQCYQNDYKFTVGVPEGFIGTFPSFEVSGGTTAAPINVDMNQEFFGY